MSTLFLCGSGNASGIRLAINVNRHTQRWDEIVILDDNPDKLGNKILGCEIIAGFAYLANANKLTDNVVNLVAGSTTVRKKVRDKLLSFGIPFAPLIHPLVDTLGVTFKGEDITVYENATLGANASMEDGCIVFMNAVLGHGAAMKAGSILGPGSVLNARVSLGQRAYFGTNASILPDLVIGEDAVVGANSSVICSVPDKSTFVGIPAQDINATTIVNTEALSLEQDFDADTLLSQLQSLWAKTLDSDKIKIKDNFFELGGSSRQAMALVEEMKKETGIPFTPIDIFHYPSISAILKRFASDKSNSVKKDGGQYAKAKNRGQARALARSHARAWARQH